MATEVEEYGATKAVEEIDRALRGIKSTLGFNTTPTVEAGLVAMDKIEPGEMPFLCYEMGDLTPDLEDSPMGLVRFSWRFVVAGYFWSDAGKSSLREAGLALLADIQAALWDDESLPDPDGVGTVEFVHPGNITFDAHSLSESNKGWFAAEFTLQFDLERSGTP